MWENHIYWEQTTWMQTENALKSYIQIQRGIKKKRMCFSRRIYLTYTAERSYEKWNTYQGLISANISLRTKDRQKTVLIEDSVGNLHGHVKWAVGKKEWTSMCHVYFGHRKLWRVMIAYLLWPLSVFISLLNLRPVRFAVHPFTQPRLTPSHIYIALNVPRAGNLHFLNLPFSIMNPRNFNFSFSWFWIHVLFPLPFSLWLARCLVSLSID